MSSIDERIDALETLDNEFQSPGSCNRDLVGMRKTIFAELYDLMPTLIASHRCIAALEAVACRCPKGHIVSIEAMGGFHCPECDRPYHGHECHAIPATVEKFAALEAEVAKHKKMPHDNHAYGKRGECDCYNCMREKIRTLTAENEALQARLARIKAAADDDEVDLNTMRDGSKLTRHGVVQSLSFWREEFDEQKQRADAAEAKLATERESIRECLRDNMRLILPEWDEANPDIPKGVEAEIGELQARMIAAEVRADAAEAKLAEVLNAATNLNNGCSLGERGTFWLRKIFEAIEETK